MSMEESLVSDIMACLMDVLTCSGVNIRKVDLNSKTNIYMVSITPP